MQNNDLDPATLTNHSLGPDVARNVRSRKEDHS